MRVFTTVCLSRSLSRFLGQNVEIEKLKIRSDQDVFARARHECIRFLGSRRDHSGPGSQSCTSSGSFRFAVSGTDKQRMAEMSDMEPKISGGIIGLHLVYGQRVFLQTVSTQPHHSANIRCENTSELAS